MLHTGIRSAQSLVVDSKHLTAKYDGPTFKGYYEGPSAFKGVRQFFCVQSTLEPDKVLCLGDRILDQVFMFGLVSDHLTWKADKVDVVCVLIDLDVFDEWSKSDGKVPVDVGLWCRATIAELYSQVLC